MASMSQVSQGYISEVESGKKRLSPAAAEKIAPVLGLEPGKLLTGVRTGALKGILEDGGESGPLVKEILEVMMLVEAHMADNKLRRLLTATLLDALGDAAERDKARLKELESAATKSSKASGKGLTPTRDAWGRRLKHDAEPRVEVALKSRQPIVRDNFGRNRSNKGRVERDSFGRNRSKRDGRAG